MFNTAQAGRDRQRKIDNSIWKHLHNKSLTWCCTSKRMDVKTKGKSGRFGFASTGLHEFDLCPILHRQEEGREHKGQEQEEQGSRFANIST